MPIVESGTDSIERAAAILCAGGVIAFPTETVYGLGADTFNESALLKVYQLKGRPFDNPLIAHVLDVAQAKQVALQWDSRCQLLADRFWPGPLTIVVPKADSVPARATAGYPTIAIRSPSHEIARLLLKSFGGPISAPSANRSGHVSPTRALHVAEDFRDEDLLVLEGGPSEVGIESTVLDLSRDPPRILRPGSVSAEAIRSALGGSVFVEDAKSQAASPGTAAAHYAPHTPAEIIDCDALGSRLASSREQVVAISHHRVDVLPPHALIEMPASPEQYASQLYDALRRADSIGAERILIVSPVETGAMWDAIRDRLQRAAGEKGV